MQHIASGIGAYLERESSSLKLPRRTASKHFGAVGWIGSHFDALHAMAGRSRIRTSENSPITAQSLSLAAAAEASVDAGEAIAVAAEER